MEGYTHYPTAREETATVKAALKAAGYNARVYHGTGTAADWIGVDLIGTWTMEEFWRDHYRQAYKIVKHAAGRDHLQDITQADYFEEHINVRYRAPVIS